MIEFEDRPKKRKSDTEPNQNAKKTTNNLKFQRGWLDKFNWLRFDTHDPVMHCALCRDAYLESTFKLK